MPTQPGLKWVWNTYFQAEPTWTRDPDVEKIIKLARQHLQLSDGASCTADYYMQGAFNKIYLIRCRRDSKDEKSFIFRVSLPVDPGFKIACDIATMEFVRDHTDAPIPRVLAFDPSHKNELGFEWTMMEKMPGRPLCEQWNYMTGGQKEKLVKRLAEIWAQIFRHKFRGIGGIYQNGKSPLHQAADCDAGRAQDSSADSPGSSIHIASKGPPLPSKTGSDESKTDSRYGVGRIVSMPFFWHRRVHYDIYRGPFDTAFDWLTARLALVIMESDAVINEAGVNQKQKAFASKYSSIAKRLRQQLPNFFPPDTSYPREVPSEITVIHHHDTSGYNVLVDEEGMLTALLDWDSVSTVPFWKACQMPDFLLLRHIDEMVDDEKTGRTDRDCAATKISKDEAVYLEKERLRTVFLQEMERIVPDWVNIHRSCVRLADFEAAVYFCNRLFDLDVVDEWLEGIEQGNEYRSLQRRLETGNWIPQDVSEG